MRVTKADFEYVVQEMRKTCGKQLYLVQSYHCMYVSTFNDTSQASVNFILETSDSYSKANLDIYRAYLAGMTHSRFGI